MENTDGLEDMRPLQRFAKKGMRVFEVWEGMNEFYFGGKIVTGPVTDLPAQMVALVVFLIPLLLYYGTMSTHLEGVYSGLPMFFGALMGVTFLFYIFTFLSDPGLLPRKDFILARLTSKTADECSDILPVAGFNPEQMILPTTEQSMNQEEDASSDQKVGDSYSLSDSQMECTLEKYIVGLVGYLGLQEPLTASIVSVV